MKGAEHDYALRLSQLPVRPRLPIHGRLPLLLSSESDPAALTRVCELNLGGTDDQGIGRTRRSVSLSDLARRRRPGRSYAFSATCVLCQRLLRL